MWPFDGSNLIDDLTGGQQSSEGLTDTSGSDQTSPYIDSSGSASINVPDTTSTSFSTDNSNSGIIGSISGWLNAAAPLVLARVIGTPSTTPDGEIAQARVTRPPSSNAATGGKAATLSVGMMAALGVGAYLLLKKR